MSIPTKPGQPCRVIGGRSNHTGEGQGPNIGKTVVTVYLHKEQAGIEQENVWHCSSKDILQTYYGAGYEADFLECWLEVIPPEVAPAKELKHELRDSQ
jgi:hypothetical protein